jgi:hypothetical protein
VKCLESLGIAFSAYAGTTRQNEEEGCYFEIVAEGFGEKPGEEGVFWGHLMQHKMT